MNFKEFWHYLITDPKKQQAQGISADGTFDPEHPITTSSSTKRLGNGVILFILINSILGSSLF